MPGNENRHHHQGRILESSRLVGFGIEQAFGIADRGQVSPKNTVCGCCPQLGCKTLRASFEGYKIQDHERSSRDGTTNLISVYFGDGDLRSLSSHSHCVNLAFSIA